jgi:hypothetical protein
MFSLGAALDCDPPTSAVCVAGNIDCATCLDCLWRWNLANIFPRLGGGAGGKK